MFNLQGSEIVIILLLALVVLGPEKLPDAMRRAGQALAELKKMSAGFQSEFRAAVDEPMREIRSTANVLRDSADFTKLQKGDRDEKPKSADMAPADPASTPTADVPTFETDDAGATDGSDPAPADNPKPAPFSGQSSAAPRTPRDLPPSTVVEAPPPFTAMSAPRPDEPVTATDAFGAVPPVEPSATPAAVPTDAVDVAVDVAVDANLDATVDAVDDVDDVDDVDEHET